MIYKIDKLYKFIPKNINIFIAAIIIASIFFPLIIYGTFYIDDWGFIIDAYEHDYNLISTINIGWQTLGYRPVANLIINISTFLFRDTYWLYVICNLVIYFVGIQIVLGVFGRFVGIKRLNKNAIVQPLFFLAFISTTFLFSATTHIVTIFSFIMWSLTLLWAEKYVKTKRPIFIILSFVGLLSSLLCYEIILPLMVFNLLIIIGANDKNNNHYFRSLIKNIRLHYLLLIAYILSLTAGLFYQKFVVSWLGFSDYSRMSVHSLGSLVRLTIVNFHKLLVLTFIDIPVAAKISIKSAAQQPYSLIVASLLALVISYSLYKLIYRNKNINTKRAKTIFITVILVIIVSCLMIAISGYPLTIAGYANRMLFPIWFSGCIGIFALTFIFYKHKITYIILAIASFLICLAFFGVQGEFIQASKLRNNIQKDFTIQMSNIKDSKVIVIADIPQCTQKPIINMEVFSVIWDFNGMAKLAVPNKIYRSANVQLQNHNYLPWYEINANKLKLFAWWELKSNDPHPVYLYQYSISNNKSSLIKATNWVEVMNFTSRDNVAKNDTCRVVTTYEKADNDLNNFLINYLK